MLVQNIDLHRQIIHQHNHTRVTSCPIYNLDQIPLDGVVPMSRVVPIGQIVLHVFAKVFHDFDVIFVLNSGLSAEIGVLLPVFVEYNVFRLSVAHSDAVIEEDAFSSIRQLIAEAVLV